MMSIFSIALVLLICILFGVIGWLTLSQRRLASRLELIENEMGDLQMLVSALSVSASGAGQDLILLRQRLQDDQPAETIEQDVARYTEASRLLQSGTQDAVILKECGLARAELDLLRAVGQGSSTFTEK
ncbi:hypothetical protein DC094_15555 [Pelagibaculum spongiae]|uniref:DUF2802 domain-containing protein n=1 Tax=Pelagibaculum spongiae TaxID=2080658 RepID=A0A2V1GRT0_9GAMM|nr:hypothetical protein DC094_15555 [Pelagibaculum spongiae]